MKDKSEDNSHPFQDKQLMNSAREPCMLPCGKLEATV